MLVSAREMTRQAFEEGYAVGAFNVTSVVAMEALVRAAEAERSPAIAMLWSGTPEFVDAESLAAGMVSLAERADVPIALHLDHSYTLDLVQRCLDMGFTSVMFDGATLPYEENVAKTLEAKRMAKAAGDASVEAVIGEIGQEAAPGSAPSSEVQFTDPEEALRFAKDTQVDMLAIAVGTTHGHYTDDNTPTLDAALVQQVRAAGIPMVLHGGSYAPDDQVRAVVAAGVGKVNVATELEDAVLEAWRACDLEHARYTSEVLGAGFAAMTDKIAEKMRVFGSSGKA